ncbi:MAG: amidohydrolase family protein [Gemmatimonadales bacterium]
MSFGQGWRSGVGRGCGAAFALALAAGACERLPVADLLIVGGTVYDGSGGAPRAAAVVVQAGRIVSVGAEGRPARDTLDATGLIVAPGFIDMHSHAELEESWGRDGLPVLTQGITTVALGVDGAGVPEVGALFRGLTDSTIGVNAFTYVGHGTIRRRVMGMANRAPGPEELAAMKALVRQGMEQGAVGLSTGLFYTPGTYAATEEVIELAKVAAEYSGIYDTHDRDLGAAYPGVGYDNSVKEAIRIGEESGSRVIFSHFNPQGARNYGRAHVGAELIEAARARGVDVRAAQHPYTATQSNLRSYTIPDWAASGGDTALVRRFDDSDTVRVIERETLEMLAIRGGPEKLLFADPRPELNGRTLAQVAEGWGIPAPEAACRILRDGNAAVMNLDLYDAANTRFLAREPWMMTCTDGRTPAPGQKVTHPRVFGAFSKKLRDFVIDDTVITMTAAVRSMTGLAADFLGLPDRGYLRAGQAADIAVLDSARIRDRATYEDPSQASEGTVHVLVNGRFAIRDGKPADVTAGRVLRRRADWTARGGPR